MLRVSYKNPMGYVIVKRDGWTKKRKFDLCFANVSLFAEIEHIGNEHVLQSFYADNRHLKNIVKHEGEYAPLFLKGYEYRFNSYYNVVNNTTIKLLNQLGAKVSFYYEKTKKK